MNVTKDIKMFISGKLVYIFKLDQKKSNSDWFGFSRNYIQY